MKLSTREDVEAPAEFVWDVLSDFVLWERTALRRGIEVQRLDGLPMAGPGMGWMVRFAFQGKPREINLRLAAIEPGQRLTFEGQSTSVRAHLALDVVQLAPLRTRVAVVSEVRPQTIGARVLVQSLKLARGRLQLRYEKRVAGLAAEIEDRWRAHRGG
ncbi:polyketide cyclase/dehydrase/lipid transport protein [Cereibacter ovatus]|uniref:Polyketide cyclase/dehydrase/lipid transport protein n=1 Tax=Cereibacter ovatus TaxID=439529 RepID=A0A285CNP3_9RHOB|nr:SRPBCC family protein [Cereibacter ovatus]SNX68668.1 polyketide cyclase/dehydrase/lipid transport protein [Cereibacter ovatus]